MLIATRNFTFTDSEGMQTAFAEGQKITDPDWQQMLLAEFKQDANGNAVPNECRTYVVISEDA